MIKDPVLGLDFVGTISDHPQFFHILTQIWKGKIVIISHADSVEELQLYLNEFGIRYDKAICVPPNRTKAEIIIEEKVDFYFDDVDQNHWDIPSHVSSFLVRGEGNFDFEKQRWKPLKI